MASKVYAKSVDQSDVTEFITLLGFDPNVVEKIEIRPDAVFVTEQLRNADGQKYVIGCAGDPHLYDEALAVANIGELARHVVEVPLRKAR